MGRCGLEGVHTDNKGRIYLVEDTGGKGVSNDQNDINGPNKVAKQPNSYVFRFVPYDHSNLDAGGWLQALRVYVDGEPLVFGGTSDQQAFDDVWSSKQIELHSGSSFPTDWVTVHDTATDGTTDFDCNLAARNGGATPFKRPENGLFKPDAHSFSPSPATRTISPVRWKGWPNAAPGEGSSSSVLISTRTWERSGCLRLATPCTIPSTT
jgi:hypothetical protein